jgi:hypothetical protein
MKSAQQTTELALKQATDAWESTRARLSVIIGLPLYNTCKGVETPQSLRDEIAALETLLPQQSAEIDRAYAVHLAANGLSR